MSEIKTSMVTDFLRFIIDTSMAFQVDDDGYVLDKQGERITLGDPARPLILYQERISDQDAIILNPFSEGIQETEGGKFLYKMIRSSLAARILHTMRVVIDRALAEQKHAALKPAQRKKQKEPLDRVPPVFTDVVAAVVNDVDEKMLAEIDALRKHNGARDTVNGIVYLLYMKKLLTTSLDVPLISEGDEYSPPSGVRQGSVPVFRKMLMAMFKVKSAQELADFKAKASENATPKIDSQARCLFNVYNRLNELFDAIDSSFSIDLTAFQEHLANMPAYSQNARSVITVPAARTPTTSVPVQHHAPSATSPVTPAPQSTTPTYAPQPAPSMRPSHVPMPASPGTIRIPGPQRSDGLPTQDIEIRGPSYGYNGMPMPTSPTPMMPGMMMDPSMYQPGNAGWVHHNVGGPQPQQPMYPQPRYVPPYPLHPGAPQMPGTYMYAGGPGFPDGMRRG